MENTELIDSPIQYAKGYKYQLKKHACIKLKGRLYPEVTATFAKIRRDRHGAQYLIVKHWYAWNGADEPTIDTKSTQRASLTHDVLSQMMREEYLPQTDEMREAVDSELVAIGIRDKMYQWRARLWGWVLSKTSGDYTKPKGIRKVYTAP